jgi:putative membrane protein
LAGFDQSQPGDPKPQGKPAPGKPAPDPAAKPAASPDSAFMRQAAMANMAEVALGQAAAKNAASGDVKQFAQRMVDDHSKALDELKSLASKKSVTLPTELDAKHKGVGDKLSKQQGAAFDTAYMSHMVSAHAEAVGLFEREAKSGKDPDAKAWAEKTLPTVKEHHKMAQDVRAKVKPGASDKK